MNPYITTFLVSLLPVIELRGGIPIGFGLGLPLWHAVAVSFVANVVVILGLLWGIPHVLRIAASHIKWVHDFLLSILTKTRSTHERKMKRYGHIGLVLFVAFPLPGTGIWTGALLAYLFGVPFWTAARLLTLGLAFAALFMVGITAGFSALF